MLIVDSFLGDISYTEVFPVWSIPDIFRCIVAFRDTRVPVVEVGPLDTLWVVFIVCFLRRNFFLIAVRT